MKVWLKRILIGLVVAFLVALVGIAIFLLTFDPNAYKNKLQEIVYARYERTLTIDGDIELSLFPRIGLSVQKVSLSDRGNSDLFASMESARLAVAIWPLMFDRLVVDHVAVTGFQAWVTRNEKGEYNFQDLLSRRQSASLPAADIASPRVSLTGSMDAARAAIMAASAIPVAAAASGDATDTAVRPDATASPQTGSDTDLQIDIAGLTLRNGRISLQDRKRGYVGHIRNLELNTGRMTADQPFDLAFRGQLLGNFPTADARFEGQALIKFNTDQKTYSAQRVNVQASGLLGPLQARSVGLRGNLAYSAYSQMFSAAGIDFSVQGGIQGEQPIENFEASLTVPALKLDRSQAELHVEKLSFRSKGQQAGETVEVGLDAPNLSISPEAARGDPLTATVQIQGKEDRVAMVLGMSGLGGNASQLTLKELKLDGRMQEGKQLVQINMTSPASWNVFEERGNLSAMRGDVRIEHPALPGGTFEFPFIGSIAADLHKDEIKSELDAVLSGSKLGFRVGVTRLERPKVDFALQADHLDFNTLFPAAAKVAAPGSPAAQAKQKKQQAEEAAEKPVAPPAPAQVKPAAPAKTVKLAFLRNMDLSGTLNVGQLKIQQVEASDFAANVRAVDGKLEVKDVKAQLYDGSLVGKFGATADNHIELDLTATGLSMEPLVQALIGERTLAGKGTLRARVDSQGMTMPALLAELNGTVQLQVRDGAIRGIDAAQTLRQVQQLVRSVATGEARDVPLKLDTGTETAFSVLETDVQFSKGQGTVRKLNLVSPAVRVSQGKPASIDLVNQQLDVVVNLRVGGNTTETRDLMALRGVTVPLRVAGAFSDPSYQVQWKDIGGVAVREAVKDGLLQLLGNQLESAVPGVSPPQPPAPAPGPGAAPAAPKDPMRAIGEALKGLLGQ